MNDDNPMTIALRAALPVMRRTVWEYLGSVTIHRDPDTIVSVEWEEIADDVRAIWAATACVGPQPDQYGVDTAWLDDILATQARQYIMPINLEDWT